MRWLRLKNIVRYGLYCINNKSKGIGVEGSLGGRHEVPVLVEDGFYVLALAGEFALVVRVGEDAALGENYVLADFSDFSVQLHLFSQLDHIQELG